MFGHHVEDIVWKSQQGLTKVKNWKLFDSCGVHCVTMQNILYYLLVEKMYQEVDGYDERRHTITLWSPTRKEITLEVFFSAAVRKMVGSIHDSFEKQEILVYAKMHKIHREFGCSFLACKQCGRPEKESDDDSSSSGEAATKFKKTEKTIQYFNHGDPNIQCQKYGAMLWLAKSQRGATIAGKNECFSLCCGKGKVKLPVALKDPPPLLRKLMNGEHRSSNSFLLYIYDPVNEIDNHIQVVSSFEPGSSSSNTNIDRNLTKEGVENVRLRLKGRRQQDGGTYNLPIANEVAALIVGYFDFTVDLRDIVLQENNGKTKRI
nr:replication protein A 70 kDa DNA-binding subunit B [Tanacetum cinerariifolium]